MDYRTSLVKIAGVAFAGLMARGRNDVKSLPVYVIEGYGKHVGELLKKKGHSLWIDFSGDGFDAGIDEHSEFFSHGDNGSEMTINLNDGVHESDLAAKFIATMPNDMMFAFFEGYDWLVDRMGGGIKSGDLAWLKSRGFKERKDRDGRYHYFQRRIANVMVMLDYCDPSHPPSPNQWQCSVSSSGHQIAVDAGMTAAFRAAIGEYRACLDREMQSIAGRIQEIDSL